MDDDDGWNPRQYLRFAELRLRPARDLLARVPGQPSRLVDLGCGPGNVTRLLAERWPNATIVGIDSSDAMLEAARRDLPAVDWRREDLADWHADRPVDLLFSNATLHWLPDHAARFPRLMAELAPGGTLAVQMPRNFTAPSHAAIAETARDGPWRGTLAPLLKPPPVAAPADYFDWLRPHSATLDIWETEYLQVLDGDDAIKEWTKGSVLKPLLDALDEPLRGPFEAAYAARVREAYPRRDDGTTLFPFRRLFVVATRAG